MTPKKLLVLALAGGLIAAAAPSSASSPRASIERGTPVAAIGDPACLFRRHLRCRRVLDQVSRPRDPWSRTSWGDGRRDDLPPQTPPLAGGTVAGTAGATPSWATTAMKFVKSNGFVNRRRFKANRPMTRKAFGRLMDQAFGGGFSDAGGKVTAREVDAALVKALDQDDVAEHLADEKSPDGWDPQISSWDGFEMVAREMGLRHDRPTNEEAFESSAMEPMLGADIAYAVWRAKVGPNTWGADELAEFELDNHQGARARVVRYAFDQVGLPYIWGGEWAEQTPAGYPYGAQAHGGVDCSGFVWYVLRSNASSWQPKQRPYRGWSLADRSSAGMAAGTNKKIGYKSLKAGDIMTFASGGRQAGASGVYHASIYLGKGWMIDSSGSQAGVGLSYVGNGSWYRDQFVWGRRLIH